MMAIEGAGQKTVFQGEVDIRHSSRWGFDWILRPADAAEKLSPPFLLTSDLQYSLVYQGKVEIELDELAQSDDPSAFDGPTPLRNIASRLVAVLDQCLQNGRDHLTGTLTAFATKCQHFSIISSTWDFVQVEGL